MNKLRFTFITVFAMLCLAITTWANSNQETNSGFHQNYFKSSMAASSGNKILWAKAHSIDWCFGPSGCESFFHSSLDMSNRYGSMAVRFQNEYFVARSGFAWGTPTYACVDNFMKLPIKIADGDRLSLPSVSEGVLAYSIGEKVYVGVTGIRADLSFDPVNYAQGNDPKITFIHNEQKNIDDRLLEVHNTLFDGFKYSILNIGTQILPGSVKSLNIDTNSTKVNLVSMVDGKVLLTYKIPNGDILYKVGIFNDDTMTWSDSNKINFDINNSPSITGFPDGRIAIAYSTENRNGELNSYYRIGEFKKNVITWGEPQKFDFTSRVIFISSALNGENVSVFYTSANGKKLFSELGYLPPKISKSYKLNNENSTEPTATSVNLSNTKENLFVEVHKSPDFGSLNYSIGSNNTLTDTVDWTKSTPIVNGGNHPKIISPFSGLVVLFYDSKNNERNKNILYCKIGEINNDKTISWSSPNAIGNTDTYAQVVTAALIPVSLADGSRSIVIAYQTGEAGEINKIYSRIVIIFKDGNYRIQKPKYIADGSNPTAVVEYQSGKFYGLFLYYTDLNNKYCYVKTVWDMTTNSLGGLDWTQIWYDKIELDDNIKSCILPLNRITIPCGPHEIAEASPYLLQFYMSNTNSLYSRYLQAGEGPSKAILSKPYYIGEVSNFTAATMESDKNIDFKEGCSVVRKVLLIYSSDKDTKCLNYKILRFTIKENVAHGNYIEKNGNTKLQENI